MRFTAKKYKNVKVEATENGVKIGYYDLDGYGVFDNQRNEFVIISSDEEDKFNCFKRKSVAQNIADQFNQFGATCGNDNLRLIERL